MTYVVQTNKLTKTIGEKNLVTNVSMHVKKGEIYGFLGPNGAGKNDGYEAVDKSLETDRRKHRAVWRETDIDFV